MELYNTSFYNRDFRQYWQPYYRLNRQPYGSVPVRPVPVDHIQTLNMDDRKWYGKSKSKTTRARDKIRKQNFIERKTICSGLPFFGLDDKSIRKNIAIRGTY